MTSVVKRTLPVVMSVQADGTDDLPAMNAIYAHGKLERRMGYDCVCGKVTIKPGIHPCVAREDGEVSCLAFIWVDGSMPGITRHCGLVVQADDLEAIAHAASKMVEGKGC